MTTQRSLLASSRMHLPACSDQTGMAQSCFHGVYALLKTYLIGSSTHFTAHIMQPYQRKPHNEASPARNWLATHFASSTASCVIINTRFTSKHLRVMLPKITSKRQEEPHPISI